MRGCAGVRVALACVKLPGCEEHCKTPSMPNVPTVRVYMSIEDLFPKIIAISFPIEALTTFHFGSLGPRSTRATQPSRPGRVWISRPLRRLVSGLKLEVHMGVSQNSRYHFEGPHKKDYDYSILGSSWGPHIKGDYHMS